MCFDGLIIISFCFVYWFVLVFIWLGRLVIFLVYFSIWFFFFIGLSVSKLGKFRNLDLMFYILLRGEDMVFFIILFYGIFDFVIVVRSRFVFKR